MKTLLFALFVISGSFLFGQNKEVLIVEQFPVGTKWAGIYIFQDGQEIENIDVGKGDIIEQTKILSLTISKLYKEGWEIVTMSGQSSLAKYIFEREKK